MIATACRSCREPLALDGHFCTRCGLPTADACPRCGVEIPLAAGECGACASPLVHCGTCGRNYTVDRTQCENVDWNCQGAPLESAHGAFAGLYGSLARTSSARGGPVLMQPLKDPLFTFSDAAERVIDVLSAYGRAYIVTPQSLLSLPLSASGDIDALHPAVRRSEPLAARGREFRRILDAAVGFGQVCILAEKHDRQPQVFVFRADDVSAWWRLEGTDARAVVPVPQGVLVFTRDRRVERYALGSTVAEASAALPVEPHVDAPPAVHVDGAYVVYGSEDAVVRIHVQSLESAVLLRAPQIGPPVLGPRFVHVLSREPGAPVTVLHQMEVDSGTVDAVSLGLASDLRLRGAAATRLVYDGAYRAVRVDPWPARMQAEAMPRPANEDIVSDLVLDHAAFDLLLATREGPRSELRLVRFDGETVLRGVQAGTRFAACDDRLLLWGEGTLQCFALA